MKIGVFGDSFAADFPGIWWHHLQNQYGHTVKGYGVSGTGVLYSAKIITHEASKYDIAIWCVSAPIRMTVDYNGIKIHLPSPRLNYPHYAPVKHAFEEYLVYLHNIVDDIFVCNALIDSITNKHKNIMIIPCFPDPIFSDSEVKGFNLFEVSKMEARHWFPDSSLEDVWRKFQDRRPGHISVDNQKILAKCINDNLVPGIFQTEYSNFNVPHGPVDDHFK